MRKNLMIILGAVALIAGCGTTGEPEQSGAPVEDRDAKRIDGTQVKPVTADDQMGTALAAVRQGVLAKRSVFFDYDSYVIKDEYKSLVEAHAKFLVANPKVKMLVQGNADERGSREYNIGLGERRGNAVSSSVQANGGSGTQVTVVSYGEERPTCTESTEECWGRNRRVEIVYTAK